MTSNEFQSSFIDDNNPLISNMFTVNGFVNEVKQMSVSSSAGYSILQIMFLIGISLLIYFLIQKIFIFIVFIMIIISIFIPYIIDFPTPLNKLLKLYNPNDLNKDK